VISASFLGRLRMVSRVFRRYADKAVLPDNLNVYGDRGAVSEVEFESEKRKAWRAFDGSRAFAPSGGH
jgi:hypothetical protein